MNEPNSSCCGTNECLLLLDIVYSQPADTGTGNNVNTQLVYAVSYMKVRGAVFHDEQVLMGEQGKQGPMRIEDIAAMTETPLDTDPVLREKFKMHDKIQFDPKTNLYSYKVRLSPNSSQTPLHNHPARLYVQKQSRAVN